MFALRNRLLLTRGAILFFITFLQALRISEGVQFTKKEVNQSIAVSQSVNLSWSINYTAQENSQDRVVDFYRYPEHDSSAVVKIGGIAVVSIIGPNPAYPVGPFHPRIAVVQSASAISEPVITIEDVTKQDEAFYRIEVKVGSAGVVDSHTIFLTVFDPTNNVTTDCGRAVRGKAMTCNCTADGDPVPSFEWRAPNGTVLHSGSSYITPQVEQSLDGSYYTCVASNGFGSASTNTSLFNVLFGPTITNVAGENRPICEGEQVVLTCEAEGNPKPYLAWKRKGIVLQNSTNTSYTISSVKRGDEGSYTCEATNVAGSASNLTSIVDVQFPANVSSITPNDSYVLNTRVELKCSVEGDPTPYVAWFNVANGSLIQNSTVTTSYVIPSVSSIHKGTYRCVTGNRCGNDSEETTIIDVLADRCQECEVNNTLCVRRENEVFCKCKPEDINCTTDSTLVKIRASIIINNTVKKRKRRSAQITENLTNVTVKIENFFKTKFGSVFLWIRIINSSKEAGGTKVVFDAVFKPNTSYTQKEVLDALEKAKPGDLGFSISLADPCNPNPCPSAQPECTGTPGTAKHNCLGKKDTTVPPSVASTKKVNVGAIAGGVGAAVGAVVLVVIIAVVVTKVKKKRNHKNRRVSNWVEYKLEERDMRDPSVEARAGGYSNAGLDHYINDGPTASKNKNTGKKPKDLYAKIDMSKKSKKKNPGEILYVDLEDIPQTQAAAKSANTGQQPIKNPRKHQSTDNASITDIMQKRERGSFR